MADSPRTETESTGVLLVSDEASVRDEVRSVLAGMNLRVEEMSEGAAVSPAVKRDPYDLIILDLQVGNMGGMASCMDLRLEESAGRLPHVPVLMLLDRRADVFLARRSGAEGWIIKPLDPIRLRKAIRAILAGGSYYDTSYQPVPMGTG
ncbi:MAG TPA: response regulator [Acidimicrobiales bacterium]|nr:response regulator [Acidimicrobiales bacterium]